MSTCAKPLGPMGFNCPDPVCKRPAGHEDGCAWWPAPNPFVSGHDRGAFGALLAEAKALGCGGLRFSVSLYAPDDSDVRWRVDSVGVRSDTATGRTGEEALRRLVDALRIAHGEGQG